MGYQRKLDESFKKSFTKKQYLSVLGTCLTFSTMLVGLFIGISIIVKLIGFDGGFMKGLSELFSFMWFEYVKIFLFVTGILFFMNRHRLDLSGLNKKEEFDTFKEINEPILRQEERGEKIDEILN